MQFLRWLMSNIFSESPATAECYLWATDGGGQRSTGKLKCYHIYIYADKLLLVLFNRPHRLRVWQCCKEFLLKMLQEHILVRSDDWRWKCLCSAVIVAVSPSSADDSPHRHCEQSCWKSAAGRQTNTLKTQKQTERERGRNWKATFIEGIHNVEMWLTGGRVCSNIHEMFHHILEWARLCASSFRLFLS